MGIFDNVSMVKINNKMVSSIKLASNQAIIWEEVNYIINLTSDASIVDINEKIIFIATITDDNGNPIENKEITFYDSVAGEIIGSGTSDSNGQATIQYSSNTKNQLDIMAYNKDTVSNNVTVTVNHPSLTYVSQTVSGSWKYITFKLCNLIPNKTYKIRYLSASTYYDLASGISFADSSCHNKEQRSVKLNRALNCYLTNNSNVILTGVCTVPAN